MMTNRLLGGQAQGGKVTREQIVDYCAELNRCRFVIESGQPYRVVEKQIGDELRLTLERYIPKWTPDPQLLRNLGLKPTMHKRDAA